MATAETKTVLISEIGDEKFEADDPRHWPSTGESMESLSKSMKLDGQLLPIRIRPNPAHKPDEKKSKPFLFIDGRKRVKAARTLGWKVIEASIDTEISDPDHIERAIIAANLWRCPLRKPRHIAAVQRYWQLWKKEAEEKAAKTPAPTEPPVPSPAPPFDPTSPPPTDQQPLVDTLSTSGISKPSSDPEQPTETTETTEPSQPADTADPSHSVKSDFTNAVAETTGVSPRSVRRVLRIAETFSKEQLDAFDAFGLNQNQMTELAKIEDQAQRDLAVNLVLSGMPVEEAISKAVPPPPVVGAIQVDAARSDEEWLSHWCGVVRGRLSDTTCFDTSAKLYRAVREERGEFKRKCQKKVDEAAKPAAVGFFTRLAYQFVHVAHPKDWLICGACDGSGIQMGTAVPARCPACRGEGFKVTMEKT